MPKRLHPGIASGQQLVRIALMPHIPHQSIARRIEHVMQRDRKLDDAEPGTDVSPSSGADVDEAGADVGRQRA